MQAIRTKFVGFTDTQGARIVATSHYGRTVYPYDHELNLDDNHARAAELHAGKAWRTDAPVRLTSGALPDGSHAHVVAVTMVGA